MIKDYKTIKSESEIKKLAFLYEASNVLFTSLKYDTTFHNIARLCVPDLADYCVIDIKSKHGTIKRVTAVHADPSKSYLTDELCKYPPTKGSLVGPAKAFRTGEIEIVSHIDESWLNELYQDEKHKDIFHNLHPTAGLFIPLKVRGETLGVLSLVSTDTPRTYTEDDLAIVRGLATRISITLDNAQLYQEAQDELKRRQEVEEELIKSKEQLEVFFQSVADGISVQDVSGKLVYANDAAAKALGFDDAEDLLQAPLTVLMQKYTMMDETDKPFPPERLPGRRALQGEKDCREIIKFIINATGEVRYALVKASPVFGKNKKVQFAVNVFHDITQRKEEERRVNQFIGFAGHELKSPLASIKAFVQLLKKRFEKQQDTTAIDYLSKVDQKINVLTKLINDYLDITKIRANRFEYFDEVLFFNELLDDVVADMQQTTTHKLIVEGDANAQVVADKNRIVQVLSNLIQNAIKYSPQANEIVITTKISNKYVDCSIKDYGIGIAHDKLNKLFQPYYRATDPAKGKFPGLGLGLYISSEIIKHYGGKLHVESKEGKGSIFTLQLPRWKEK